VGLFNSMGHNPSWTAKSRQHLHFVKSERLLPSLHHSVTKLYPDTHDSIPHLRYRSLNILFYPRSYNHEKRPLAHTGRISVRFDIGDFHENRWRKSKFSWKHLHFVKSERLLPCLHHSVTKLYPDTHESIPHLRYRSLNIFFYPRSYNHEKRPLAHTGRISVRFDIGDFHENRWRKSKFSYNRSEMSGHFTWRPTSYVVLLPATLNCHNSAIFKWNAVRLLG
jgi:hypothetical protein